MSLRLTAAELELRYAIIERLYDMRRGDLLGTVEDVADGGDVEAVVHVLWTLVEEDLVVRIPGGRFVAGPLPAADRFPRPTISTWSAPPMPGEGRR